MSSEPNLSTLSSFRLRFFPVYNSEFPKFFALNFMQIFIIFNFWMVHNMKDTLIVTSSHSGAEAISFIKMWAVFPVSVGFVILYTWLSNRVSQKRLFHGILWAFVIFYTLFALFLYPNQSSLQMTPDRIFELQQLYPHLKWFFPMVGYWTYTLFYVFAELWSTVVLILLFWQFANQITAVDQAKRFYMMFSTFSALGIAAAGVSTGFLNAHFTHWDDILTGTVGVVVVNCFVIMILYDWITRNIVTKDQQYHTLEEIEGGLKVKNHRNDLKLSLIDSLKYIAHSKYLIYIAIITIGYNVSINLVEITWKSQLKEVYPDKHLYNQFMGEFNLWLAVGMIISGLIGVNVVRKFSWYVSAMTTPVVLLVTGSLFFALVIFGDTCFGHVAGGICATMAAAWIGLFQNIAARVAKSGFFNTTREMAYIPLDAELKVKGKAAVDVLSNSVGKLGGAAIQQSLLVLIPASTQLSIAPFIAVMLVVLVGAWMVGVKRLSVCFSGILKQQSKHS